MVKYGVIRKPPATGTKTLKNNGVNMGLKTMSDFRKFINTIFILYLYICIFYKHHP